MRCWILVACAVVANAQMARADIIIDDFGDSASAGGFVDRDATETTLSVGELSLERKIGVHVLTGDVVGTIDSNATVPGHLSADMYDVISNPPPTIGPIAWMQISYLKPFPGLVDLSEGGKNDTLFLDFQSLTGETPPPSIEFLIQEADDVLSYQYDYFPVPTSEEPFTIAIPFHNFTSRGGGPQTATFQDWYYMSITFLANEYFGAPEELGWQVVLDRIRVGAVPEPSAFLLILVGLTLFPWRLRWSNA